MDNECFSKKVIAVGKNYSAHIKEMGQPAPAAPVLFLKPTSRFVHATFIILNKSVAISDKDNLSIYQSLLVLYTMK